MSQSYTDLLTDAAPSAIRSEAEYKRTMSIIERLASKELLSPDELKLLELLAVLATDYERGSYTIESRATPLERLRFLMSENDLKQVDLVDVFGSESRVSEVINGKRGISKTQAKRLGERFRVSPGLFI
ncbi:MAG: hypothetical protein J5I65_09610 [Aridibacter famidurans]|nr:hypothetical protein [Aridibacter famidurans]